MLKLLPKHITGKEKKMNISTGLYRLAQVIKWSGRILGGLLFFTFAFQLFTSTSRSQDMMNSEVTILFLIPVGLIAITGVVAWVLEGFSDD